MPAQIEAVWNDLLRNDERPVFRRIDEAHPLDLYAGLDANDAHTLLLVTPEEPPVPPSYDTITVTSRRRADGNWALAITLHDAELTIPFTRLCQDLIDASRNTSAAGPAFLINRLARWRRLMDIAKKPLSEQALRGLLGELIILKDAVAPRFGNPAAVRAWVGPSDSPQDFLLAGIAIEVKTCTPTATTITISSLEQLSTTSPLILATVLLSPSSETQQMAFTPSQLVSTIRTQLDDALQNEYDLRLAEAGYQERPEYTTMWYECTGTRFYRVEGAFPRLTTSNVPTGIPSAIYDVALSDCAPYKLGENEPWN